MSNCVRVNSMAGTRGTRVFHRRNSPRPTQEDAFIPNDPASVKYTVFAAKVLPTKKMSGPYGFIGEFYQTFKKENNANGSQTFPRNRRGGTLPNLEELSVTLIQNQAKDIRKLWTSIPHKHRPNIRKCFSK